jgi:hypothetical protein
VAWVAFWRGSFEATGGRAPDRPGAQPIAAPIVELPDAPFPDAEAVGTEAPERNVGESPGAPAGGLRERSTAPWRVPDAAYRQIVEVALRPVEQSHDRSLAPGMPPPPRTASCELALEGGGPVRVFDRFGRERRCRIASADGGDDFEVVFEAAPAVVGEGSAGGSARDFTRDFTRDDGPFEVYYPAPGAMPLPSDEGEDGEGGVSLAVYPARHEETHALTHPRAAADFVRRTEPVAPPKRRLQIDDCTIPFDRYDNYVAAYRAYIACPHGGQHGFAVDADDRAFVVIDGKQILVGGRPDHLPDRPFPYRASVKLDAGLHALTFYHVQGKGALRSRLAWHPPAAGKMRAMPPSAFVSHLPARAVALERRDSPACDPFFSAEVSRRLVVNRDVPVTEWELAASGPLAAGGGEGLRWVWREGERVIGRGDRLDVYVSGLGMSGAGISPWRDIALALEGSEGEVARYTRRIRARARDPLEDEELGLQLEAASAPTFVYPHEPFEVHVRAVNDSTEPVELEAVEVKVDLSPRRAVARRLGRFELPEVPERGRDVIARRMNRITRHLGGGECAGLERVVFLVGPPGAPAVPLSFEVLGSRVRGVPDLSGRGGALLVQGERGARAGPAEADGVLVPPRVTRALFVLPFDSEGELRKWRMIGAIALGGGSGKALLYGDPLASAGAVGGEGLPPRMLASLKDDGTELEARPFPPGAYPIHAACAGTGREFAREKWEAVYVSLGLADCRAGTPPREFARGVDFLIDRAHVLASQAQLVIVGPPPEWTREEISRQYADAVREVVLRHGVAYVDLFSLVASLDLPGADCREPGPDDGVRFPYPLGPAMDAIAAEVLSR